MKGKGTMVWLKSPSADAYAEGGTFCEDCGPRIQGSDQQQGKWSTFLAWKIPWTEEPGSLEPTGL